MDITLHKLDQIRELLKEIKEHIKPDTEDRDTRHHTGSKPCGCYEAPIHWHYPDGSFIDTISDFPSGNPKESTAGGIYPLPCNCTTELKWHYCLKHGWCK